MLRMQITTDDATLPRVEVPSDLRVGVERANRILESELLPSQQFEIDAHWKFVRKNSENVSVLLDLTTSHEGNRVGITGYPLDADVFADDSHIRRGLDRPAWNFTSLLSYVNKLDIKHDRERLQSTLTLASTPA